MDFKDKLSKLPKDPGCYLMKNNQNEIIYVGKAKNLSNRVKSYFIGSHNAKTERLVMDITDFEWIITSSEKEALILEINLIKKHRPRYNILLTDDKIYPYILLTNESHPRLLYTRDLKKNGKYFGPYPNMSAARFTINMLNKIYPLRKCNKIPKKECLYYHIDNCLAPCIKEVNKTLYEEITTKITSFLNGNIKDEVKELKIQMNKASEELNFEKAIEIRNIITDLENVIEKQKMESSIFDADVFNYASQNDFINIQVFHIRDFKVIERSTASFELLNTDVEMFSEYINQFYLINNNPIPKEIIVPNEVFVHESLLKKIIIPKQGKRKELVELVLKNINNELDSLILKAKRSYDNTVLATIELQKLLNITSARTIEAYDNSNILGSSSVSCCVVFKDGTPSYKDYRKYLVKTIKGPDDVNTFKEIIHRRYERILKENGQFNDLIIMDGGKNQVNACLEVLQNLNIIIPVIGLVKDEFHKTSHIWYQDRAISIKEHKHIFRLLSVIQEEVHRYAITYFRKTLQKNTITSAFDSIKGIGKVKKRMILNILAEKDFEDQLKKLGFKDELNEEILKIYNRMK